MTSERSLQQPNGAWKRGHRELKIVAREVKKQTQRRD